MMPTTTELPGNGTQGAQAKARLVVVGNGMVGHHFVKTAAERGLFAAFEVTVISEEPCLA